LSVFYLHLSALPVCIYFQLLQYNHFKRGQLAFIHPITFVLENKKQKKQNKTKQKKQKKKTSIIDNLASLGFDLIG